MGDRFNAAICCNAIGLLVAILGCVSSAAAVDAQLTWSPVAGATGYKVYVRASSQLYGAGTDIGSGTLGGDGNIRYVVTGLTADTTEFFSVSAYGGAGESALSNELSLVVPTPTAAATAPPVATTTNSPSATIPPPATSTVAATATWSSAPTLAATPTVTQTVPATATPSVVSIWETTIPGNPTSSDTAAVELGVKFTSDVDGLIRGIRFYKDTTNTGTHTGTLWSSAGAPLATATFSNETTSGWQQVTFAAPVTITAGTVYVASYYTNVGRYAFDPGYFSAAGMDNPPLHALRDGVSGGNSVYVYGAHAFPTNTYQSSNYWVDVVFSPGQLATATATANATARATATATNTATRTAAPATAVTATPTATVIPPPAMTATATNSAAWTATPTPTATPTATFSPPPAITATATNSVVRTATPTATPTKATRTKRPRR